MRRRFTHFDYVKVFELQKRLSLHFHAIFAFPKEVPINTVIVELTHLRRFKYKNSDGNIYRWGQKGFDVQSIDPEQVTSAGYYLTKYLTKDATSTIATDAQTIDFYKRMMSAAARLKCSKTDCDNNCDSKAHLNFGINSRALTYSKGFTSLSMKALKDKRRDWHDKQGKENKRLLSTARMNDALATIEWKKTDPNFGKQVANTGHFLKLAKERFPDLPWKDKS